MKPANRCILVALLVGIALGSAPVAAADEPIEAIYNRGVALYREGNMEEAAEHFRRAAGAADRAVASKSRFNLGNTHYARALSALQSTEQPDPASAIESLRRAIDHYRSSLRIDPADNDARANIELASRLIEQLKEQEDKRQEEKEQGQDQEQGDKEQGQEDKEQGQEDNEQEDNEQEDNEQEDNEQEDKEQGDKEQGDKEQGDKEQQQDQQPRDQPQNGQRQDEQQQDEQQTRPSGEQPRDNSADSAQDDTGEREDSAEEPQEAPRGDLSAANSLPDPPQASPQTVQPLEADRMTEEEARKLLQSIRDRDMLRRLRRQAAERSRRVPVEKDW